MEFENKQTEELVESLMPSKKDQGLIDSRMRLVSKIHKAMKGKGWNQARLATELGVVPSLICKWLSGAHNFSHDTLYNIQEVLSINLINDQAESPIATQRFELVSSPQELNWEDINASSGGRQVRYLNSEYA